MLFSLYKDSKNVIVTKLSPIKLQELLMTDSSQVISGKSGVKSSIKGVEYIGILGSDAAINMASDEKKLSVFMRGIKIPKKYYENTIGGIMALPVNKFIVSLRKGDNIDALDGKIGERKIVKSQLLMICHLHNKDVSDLLDSKHQLNFCKWMIARKAISFLYFILRD